MKRTSPDERRLFVNAARKGVPTSMILKIFEISRSTLSRWKKRAHHPGRESFRDKEKERKRKKITPEVELSIIALRTTKGHCKDKARAGESA
jgi:transposase